MDNILVVLPTIRNLDDCIEWSNVFKKFNTTLVVVQDGEKENITIPSHIRNTCNEVILLRWKDIDVLLKKDNWIISRFDSAIRCAGWLWAAVNGLKFDYVFTFDDDTKPLSDEHIQVHLNNLNHEVKTSMYNTIPRFSTNDDFLPRGFLGKPKKVLLSHGLWLTVPDFDAETQIKFKGRFNWKLPNFTHEIPRGVLFPMCGMNILFKSEIAPAMYFGLMGEDPEKKPWGIGRWDDMLAGWLTKLWIDHIDGAVITGTPYCNHLRLSNPESNLKKEALWKDEVLCEFLLKLNQWNSQDKIKGDKINEFYANLFVFAKSNLNRDELKTPSIEHFIRNLEAASIFSNYFFK